MDERWDFDAAAARTIEAMRAGAEVISQATFVDGPWRGRADFLLRIDGTSKLGAWRYEALDAKLARAEKPTYVLQLCFYSDGIAAIQGERPEHMHVFLGVGEQRALRYDDFAAYYRRVRSRFEAAVGFAWRRPKPIRSSTAACASSTASCSDRLARRRQPGAGRGGPPRAGRATARREPADADGARAGATGNAGAATSRRTRSRRCATRPRCSSSGATSGRLGLASRSTATRAAVSSCCRDRRPAT